MKPWYALTLVFSLACASCDDPTFPTHVACIGDSITVGDGASTPQETYPAALQGMLGQQVRVQMLGHSGATALGPGAGDLPYEAQPEYVEASEFVSTAGADARVAAVIVLGTNDSKANNWDLPGRKERFIADYGRLIDHFQSLPTHPTVYVGLPPWAAKPACCGVRGEILVKDIVPALRDLALKRGLTVIDLASKTEGHPELLVDGVHPYDKGYELVADVVKNVVMGAPPRPQRQLPWWRHLPFMH